MRSIPTALLALLLPLAAAAQDAAPTVAEVTEARL